MKILKAIANEFKCLWCVLQGHPKKELIERTPALQNKHMDFTIHKCPTCNVLLLDYEAKKDLQRN